MAEVKVQAHVDEYGAISVFYRRDDGVKRRIDLEFNVNTGKYYQLGDVIATEPTPLKPYLNPVPETERGTEDEPIVVDWEQSLKHNTSKAHYWDHVHDLDGTCMKNRFADPKSCKA